MKSNYEKYIKEVWDMKDKAYLDFKKSGLKSYLEFLKKEIQGMKIVYKKQKVHF